MITFKLVNSSQLKTMLIFIIGQISLSLITLLCSCFLHATVPAVTQAPSIVVYYLILDKAYFWLVHFVPPISQCNVSVGDYCASWWVLHINMLALSGAHSLFNQIKVDTHLSNYWTCIFWWVKQNNFVYTHCTADCQIIRETSGEQGKDYVIRL